MGLLILECNETDEINEGDEIKIDVNQGTISNLTQNKTYKFQPIPPFMQELIKSGGLIEYAKTKIKG